jgi:hypothetical protein
MSPPKFDDPLRRITALPGGPALVQVAQAALVIGALTLTGCENEAETREIIDAIVDLGATDAEIVPPMVPPDPDMGPDADQTPPMPPPQDDRAIVPPMEPPQDAATPTPDAGVTDAAVPTPDAGVADAAVAADLPLIAPMPPPQDAALVIDVAMPDVGEVPPMPPPMPPPPPPQ